MVGTAHLDRAHSSSRGSPVGADATWDQSLNPQDTLQVLSGFRGNVSPEMIGKILSGPGKAISGGGNRVSATALLHLIGVCAYIANR